MSHYFLLNNLLCCSYHPAALKRRKKSSHDNFMLICGNEKITALRPSCFSFFNYEFDHRSFHQILRRGHVQPAQPVNWKFWSSHHNYIWFVTDKFHLWGHVANFFLLILGYYFNTTISRNFICIDYFVHSWKCKYFRWC